MLLGELMGAGLFAGGMVVGRWLRVTRREKPYVPPPPPDPTCQCTHAYAFHDPKTGKCSGTTRFKTSDGAPIMSPGGSYVVARKGATYELLQACGCKVYSGPQPLPEFYAPVVT